MQRYQGCRMVRRFFLRFFQSPRCALTLDLSGYTLSFSEDFAGPGLDTSVWGTRYWWGGRSLASNGEQQYFADATTPVVQAHPACDPFTIEEDPARPGVRVLAITARPSPDRALSDGLPYVSGMIQSHGRFAQLYGYFEMVARLPKGQGLWPAFWLLPADGAWPPEIDVMEVLGRDTTTYYASTHWKDASGKHAFRALPVAAGLDLSAGLNAFGCMWTETALVFYLNRVEVARIAQPASVNVPMYLLAALAVGGTWGGNPDPTTVFPARLEIDSIKVWSPPAPVAKGPGGKGPKAKTARVKG
jgi:beta-glucanase (GH16 family)